MTKLDPFNWQLQNEEQVFNKFRKITKNVFTMPDGSNQDWYIKTEGEAVNVLAFTSDNLVILFKQFRPGPQKIMYEMPGGGVDEGEDITTAAKRELEEETGYLTEDIQHTTSIHKDAYSSGVWHGFVAKNCLPTGQKNPSQGEFGKVVLVSIAEFRELLRKGQLTDVETGYAGLDHLGLL